VLEADAMASTLLHRRSFSETLWFRLQKHSDEKSALHRNADQLVTLSYILNY
jgi:hypothetical protein